MRKLSPEPGFRLTPQREAVLAVVRGARDHPTAATIYDRVQSMHPGIAYATVYNALSYLVRHGLVRELKFSGGDAARYDGRLEPHLHVICSQCGSLAEADLVLPEQLLAKAQATTGYVLAGQPLQLFGVCPSCQEANGPGPKAASN